MRPHFIFYLFIIYLFPSPNLSNELFECEYFAFFSNGGKIFSNQSIVVKWKMYYVKTTWICQFCCDLIKLCGTCGVAGGGERLVVQECQRAKCMLNGSMPVTHVRLEEMKNAYCSLFSVLHCFQFHSKRAERSPSNGALNACRIVYFISSIQHIRPDSNARARHVNYAWKCVNFPPIGKRTTMKFSSNNCQSVHLIMSRKHTFRNQTTTTMLTRKKMPFSSIFAVPLSLSKHQTTHNSIAQNIKFGISNKIVIYLWGVLINWIAEQIHRCWAFALSNWEREAEKQKSEAKTEEERKRQRSRVVCSISKQCPIWTIPNDSKHFLPAAAADAFFNSLNQWIFHLVLLLKFNETFIQISFIQIPSIRIWWGCAHFCFHTHRARAHSADERINLIGFRFN